MGHCDCNYVFMSDYKKNTKKRAWAGSKRQSSYHINSLTSLITAQDQNSLCKDKLIHDSSPLSARGAMALKLSESQFPLSSGRYTNCTTAHTFQRFPRLGGPRGFTHSVPTPQIKIHIYNLILALRRVPTNVSY